MTMLAPSLHRDVPIRLVWALLNERPGIYEKLAPFIPVDKPSDIYYRWDPKWFFTNTFHAVDFNSRPNYSAFSLDSSRYEIDTEQAEMLLTDKDFRTADAQLNVKRILAMGLANKLKIAYEEDFVDIAFNTDSWKALPHTDDYVPGYAQKVNGTDWNAHHFVDYHANLAAADYTSGVVNEIVGPFDKVRTNGKAPAYKEGTDLNGSSGAIPATGFWDDENLDGSSIIKDIEAAAEFISERCGVDPSYLAMNRATFRRLVQNENLRELFKYQAAGLPPAINVSGWLGFKEILISSIARDAGVHDQIFRGELVVPTGSVLVMCEAPASDMETPACMKTWQWKDYLVEIRGGVETESALSEDVEYIYEQVSRSHILRSTKATQPQMISNLMGFMFKNVFRRPGLSTATT